MDEIHKIAVFLVGLGAPASLYADYLDDLKKHLPHTKLFVLEWWSQDDFGMNALQSYIGNSDAILIGHSAGSVIALQAFAKWPALVKKIIMLDSHFLRTSNNLLIVSHMLDVMLSNDSSTIKNRVKSAYVPIIGNSLVFDKALKFAVDCVNLYFDQVCAMFNTMSAHSVLHIGFTNTDYQMLNGEDEKKLSGTWEKYNVDVRFLPMNHFDLIDAKYAGRINQLLEDWLAN